MGFGRQNSDAVGSAAVVKIARANRFDAGLCLDRGFGFACSRRAEHWNETVSIWRPAAVKASDGATPDVPAEFDCGRTLGEGGLLCDPPHPATRAVAASNAHAVENGRLISPPRFPLIAPAGTVACSCLLNLQALDAGGALTENGQKGAARGCSSVGRAPALQAGGQEFESPHLHHEWRRAYCSGNSKYAS